VARALGHLWGSMSAEEKLVYQNKAAAEREQLALDLEAWKAAGGVVTDPVTHAPQTDPGALVFPPARVRKICKLDPEVKGLSKEALLLICKSAELALIKLGSESVRVAQIQNRRKLLPDDVAQVCATREPFFFLRDDVQDMVRAAQKSKNDEGHSKKPEAAAQSNIKPITAYFAPKDNTT